MHVELLVLAGVLLHILNFFTIQDIYLKSPIISGVPVVTPNHTAPASRVVLFVVDGLRADKAFESDPITNTPRAPFLHSIALEKGVWGVSHDLAPTETRVGHVAMLAGMPEDFSAILNGWEDIPAPFDSVFNQSEYSFLFGAPDVIPIFRKGYSNPSKITEKIYTLQWEHSKNYAQVSGTEFFLKRMMMI